MSESKPITVGLIPASEHSLDHLCEMLELNRADVINRAVQFYEFAETSVRPPGAYLAVVSPNGTRNRVHWSTDRNEPEMHSVVEPRSSEQKLAHRLDVAGGVLAVPSFLALVGLTVAGLSGAPVDPGWLWLAAAGICLLGVLTTLSSGL